MTALRARAPGKVNLCLFLGPVRDDGLHRLVSVVESVSLADDLELAPAPNAAGDEVVCPGVEGPNLAVRAAARWEAPPQRLTIHKRVPIAAGMGGGSGDAAAALRLAALAAEHPVDPDLLMTLAPALGSDVASQLVPGATLLTAAGERVEPLAALGEHAFAVVPLDAQLESGRVFAQADRMGLARDRERITEIERTVRARLAAGRPLWPDLLVNDLQPAAIALCPEIEGALDALRAAGAAHSFVTGSGPTAVGLFTGDGAAEAAQRAAQALHDRHPRTVTAGAVDGAFGAPGPAESR
jgi:4-diphosphocytidyl-2-C-methyl-D-erythritol kinase